MKSFFCTPWRAVLALLLLSVSCVGVGKTIPLGGVVCHDPDMIQASSIWYVFCTGPGIKVYRSRDMRHWQRRPSVFHPAPAWAHRTVKGFHGAIWAPDVVRVSRHYVLYYAISAFKKNTSAIGVATNITLDSQSPQYHWVDHGIVIQSIPNRDLWNAIDPAVIKGKQGGLWMAFGSFWSGLKMVKLQSDGLRLARPQQWHTIARRYRPPFFPETKPGPAAEEAPFVFKHGNWYYLFVSWDYCCRGIKSNYKMMVGRSRSVHGPYVDENGKPLDRGGGSLVLKGDSRYPGVGSNAVIASHGVDYLVFHAYDARDHGLPKLKILPVHWSADGWPQVDQRALEQAGPRVADR